MTSDSSLQHLLEAGVRQHQAGNLADAEQLYHQALEQDPSQPDALNLLGVIAEQRGDLEQALALFDRAITAAPKLAIIPFNKGNALRDAGRAQEAQAAYEAALACDPGFHDALLNLGVLLQEEGQTKLALEHFNTLIRLNPNHHQAHYNIGKCFQARGNIDNAFSAFETALTLNPNDHDAHFAIANVCSDMARYNDAIDHIKTAIKLKPNWSEAYSNLGNYLTDIDKHEEAIRFFDKALEVEPGNRNASVNRGLTLLTQGRLEEGWQDYSERAKSDAPFYKTHKGDLPRWRGEDITNKRILVWNEQALGEEILFAGLLRDLAKTVRVCTLVCSPKLKTVFTRSFADVANLRVTDQLNKDVIEAEFDVQCSLVDLGQAFRFTMTAFPDPQPYLAWNEAARRNLRIHLEERYGANQKFIGISWASANPLIGDRKTISLNQWEPLLSAQNVTFVNVQYGDSAQDIAKLPEEYQAKIATVEMADLNGDLDETLSLLAALDQIVTCSNTTAHLAGAAGLATRVLVPSGRARIWYWFSAGSQSPWYAATTLARQDTYGRWDAAWNSIYKSVL
ncbi:MAG: tetratricopeptide repeat protein [Rhodospirillaceae bacterium]|nr:tetratricopeptide repeat protein [Rhodospirillaceae bacterium]MBT7449508.1 tetratricopeptide repeat protein [Rhodospirillaceae bacterium]